MGIILEELGLPYQAKVVDIYKGEQHAPAYIAMNPNAKVPVIFDSETNETVWESNAILLYLAETAGYAEVNPDYTRRLEREYLVPAIRQAGLRAA